VCDDGNTISGDGCSASCASDETCSNGIVDPAAGETCDDGNTIPCDGCSVLCRTEGCGNGVQECLEACDDGNLVGGDGCGPTCQIEVCGNGVVDPAEGCDDGNLAPGDGCGATCQVEPGWSCFGEPSTCALTCGNGVIDTGETCDGAALGGATCATLGFDGGTLLCSGACQLDTSGCYACQDGVCSPGESTCSCPADCGDLCGDGCCTGSETAATCFQDCSCPGVDILGTCYHLVDLNETTKAGAAAQCSALGAGWGLCTSVQVCQPAVYAYLAQGGCTCTGGATQCNCAYDNVYVHVSDFVFSAWIRAANFGDCLEGERCEEAGSATCGAVLCCY